MVTIARLSEFVGFGAQIEIDVGGPGGSEGSGREGESWERGVSVSACV